MPSEKEIEEAVKWATFMTGTSNPYQEAHIHALRDAYLSMKSDYSLVYSKYLALLKDFNEMKSERDEYKADYAIARAELVNQSDMNLNMAKTMQAQIDKYKAIVDADVNIGHHFPDWMR